MKKPCIQGDAPMRLMWEKSISCQERQLANHATFVGFIAPYAYPAACKSLKMAATWHRAQRAVGKFGFTRRTQAATIVRVMPWLITLFSPNNYLVYMYHWIVWVQIEWQVTPKGVIDDTDSR
jgi:hypothetical protein